MRKTLSFVLAFSLAGTGMMLVVMAAMSGNLTMETHRAATLYTIAGCFVFLLLLGIVFPWFAESDYKRVLRAMVLLLSLGMVMIYIFLGFAWMVTGGAGARVSMLALLPPYGLALMIAGLLNYLLSQKGYRPYIYHMARELPYLYYRYRT